MNDENNGNKIKEWFFNNILGILSFLQPFIVVIIKTIINPDRAWTELEIVLLVIIIVESFVILVKFTWNRFSYKSYYYPYTKIGSNYIIKKKHITYTLTNNDELYFSRSVTIKSKINHLDSILDKYLWTGASKASKPIPGMNVRSIEEQSLIGIWQYLRITLDDNIDKGEETEISYKWPVIQNCTSSSPFFSTSTDEPTKEIIMTIKLGNKYANRTIRLEEFRAIESDNPISVKSVQLDQNGDYTWNIPKIKRFRYYRIRWSWEDSVVPEL